MAEHYYLADHRDSRFLYRTQDFPAMAGGGQARCRYRLRLRLRRLRLDL
ncbi:MAG: hypothetical protein WBN83_13170 [Desulfoprunum sp.]